MRQQLLVKEEGTPGPWVGVPSSYPGPPGLTMVGGSEASCLSLCTELLQAGSPSGATGLSTAELAPAPAGVGTIETTEG